jgi:class 3 adenylate cyclase
VTREELYRLLEDRARHPARATEIDEAIWREAGVERAILVSDLSGFTRITRERGILAFLCIFRRVVACADPLFAEHGAVFWKTEADDLLATFASVDEAVCVAERLAETRVEDVGVCLGIGHGRILQLEDDIFGDEVNVAFKLGEDVAQPGEVLISASAARALDPARLEGPLSVHTGGMDLAHFRLRRA